MTSAVHDYQYSVQVKSRFDLLANDDFNSEDPDILLQKMKSKKHEAKHAAAHADTTSTKSVEHKSEKADQSAASRGARTDKRVGRTNADSEEVSAPQRGENWEARGGRGAARGKVGFSRSRVAKPGNQREFDRHSGSDKTGVKAVMKKDGHGTGNWGTVEDDLEVQMAETNPEAPIAEDPAAEEPAAEPEEPVEEETKKLTLKEYRDLKAAMSKVSLSTKGSRKPNDGKNVFSNMVAVHQSKPAEQVVDVLHDTGKPTDENKPCFFDFGRGGGNRGPPRGERGPREFGERGPREFGERGSGPREFGGRGGRGRGGGARFENREPLSSEQTSSAAAPTDRPSMRGGPRGSDRGGAPRGGGRGRGSGPRGAGRGGMGGDRPSFRGGERGGGRGFRGGASRGGGGFRGGRGGFDHSNNRNPTHSAPVMDSDADFPALK